MAINVRVQENEITPSTCIRTRTAECNNVVISKGKKTTALIIGIMTCPGHNLRISL